MGGIKFYVFKSGVPHSISRVTSGYRVAIIWKLELVNDETFKKEALDYIKGRTYMSESNIPSKIFDKKIEYGWNEKRIREGQEKEYLLD